MTHDRRTSMITIGLYFLVICLSCGHNEEKSKENDSLATSEEADVEEIIELEAGFFDLHDYERDEDFATIPLDVYRVPVPELVPPFSDVVASLPPVESLEERYNIAEGLKEILDTYDALLVDLTPSAYVFDVFTNEQVTVPLGECLSVAYDNDTGAFFARKEFQIDPLLGFFYYEFDILVSGEICLDETGRVGAFKNQGTLALPELGIDNFVTVATEKGIDLTGEEGGTTDVTGDDDAATGALNLASSASDKKRAQANKKRALANKKKAEKAKSDQAKKSKAAKARAKISSAKNKGVKSVKSVFKKVSSYKPLAKKAKKPSSKRSYPRKTPKSKVSLRSKGTYMPPDPGPPKAQTSGGIGSPGPQPRPAGEGNAGPLPKPEPNSSGQGNAKRLYRPNAVAAEKTPTKVYQAPSGKVYIPPSPVRKVKMAGAELPATRPQQNFHPGSSYKPRDPASEAASQLLGVRQYKKVKAAEGGTPQEQKDALKGMTDLDFLARPTNKPVKAAKKKFKLGKLGFVSVGKVGEVTPGEVLGQGGFGQVRAMDVKGKDGKVHQLAAKIFKDDASFEKARASKAQVAELGQNKHLLKDYGAGIDKNGKKVLISERGGDDFHKTFLKNNKKRPPKAVVDKAMKGMVDGMAHVNSKGKVHWDFKPQNVIMGADGEAKIIDLDDISPTSTDRKHANGRVGTPGYRAPGRGGGRQPKRPDFNWQKSDVYSVGMGLMEVKTGKSFPQIFREVTNRRYDEKDAIAIKQVADGTFHTKISNDPRYAGQGTDRTKSIFQMLNPEPTKRPDLKDVQQYFQ